MEVTCIDTSTIITFNNIKKYTLIVPLKELQEQEMNWANDM
jgi:hypothetical protein